jgi:hypothetical protein
MHDTITRIRNCTIAAALVALAACGDSTKVTTNSAPRPSKPAYGVSDPLNGADGVCLAKDAYLSGAVNGVNDTLDLADPTKNCTANDVSVASADIESYSFDGVNYTQYAGQTITCNEGEPLFVQLKANIKENATSKRTDIGAWIATDGGNARTGTCNHYNLIAPDSGTVVDGVSNVDGDYCGDLENQDSSFVELGIISTVCHADASSDSLHIGSCLGWTEPGGDQACPQNGSNTANGFRWGTVPGTTSKCNCSGFNINITVNKSASLEVVKACVPTTDPGTFDLQIDGVTQKDEATCTSPDNTTGKKTVGAGTNQNPGASHDFGELGGASTSLSNYTSTRECHDRGGTAGDRLASGSGTSGSITLQPDDDVVCTITNTRQTGTIELKKAWVGTGGQTTLQIGTSAGGTEVKSQLTGAAGAAPLTTGVQTVNTGTYYVSETGGLTGYSSALACTDNGSSITPGASNSVSVTNGHAIVCTFTNTRNTGTIELIKAWSGTAGQTTLQIGSSAGGTQVASQLTGAAGAAPLTTGTKTVNTGTYYVSETGGLTGYTSSLACTDDGSSVTPGANNSVSVATGHAVICTFTNTRDQGTIELKKVWVGPGGQTTLNIGSSAGGTQVASQQTGASGGTPLTTGSQTVNTGTYYVSETGGLTNYATSLACTDNGSSVTPGSNNSVSVAKDHAVVCTFTNSRKAQLTVSKVVTGGGTQVFDFSRTGISNFTLQNGQSNASGYTLTPGKYTVCELALAVSWSATATLDGSSVALYNPNAADVPPQDLGNRCYDVTLAYGDDKTIVFTNNPPPGGDARTIGYWKNWSSCTGGKQYIKAQQRGQLDKTLDGNLPITLGNVSIDTCQKGVYILDKRDLNGNKMASDAAYNMAAQLLAAMLNRKALSGNSCNIDQLIIDANALLVQINWTGYGPFLGKGANKTLVAKANNFATLLDKYNNNQCINYVP